MSHTNKNAANAAAKQTRNENKANNTSPLYIFHKLTKDTKKSDLTAETDGHKALLSLCKKYFGVKDFCFSCVYVDGNGRICRARKYDEDVTYNDVVTTFAGKYELIPVQMSESGILSAIQSKCVIYGTIEDALNYTAKQATKDAEKVAKAKETVTRVFGRDAVRVMSDAEILVKYDIIKAA